MFRRRDTTSSDPDGPPPLVIRPGLRSSLHEADVAELGSRERTERVVRDAAELRRGVRRPVAPDVLRARIRRDVRRESRVVAIKPVGRRDVERREPPDRVDVVPRSAERVLVGDEQGDESRVARRWVRPVVVCLARWAAVVPPALVYGLSDLSRLVTGLGDDAVVTRDAARSAFVAGCPGRNRRSSRSACSRSTGSGSC